MAPSMGVKGLSDDVAAFLRERVSSFEQLELLLLLQREPTSEWTAQAAACALAIQTTAAADALEHLRRQDLVAVTVGGDAPTFRYAPKTPALDGSAMDLARTYATARIDVVQALTANAVERMRNSTIRMFADAFLIGRKKR
jgi:hypothetical protein